MMLDKLNITFLLTSFVMFVVIETYSINELLQELEEEEPIGPSSIDQDDQGPSLEAKMQVTNEVEEKSGPFSMLSRGLPDNFKCKKYGEPKNGMVRCGGTLCLVQCNAGYTQNDQHAFVYVCGSNHKWTTIPKGKLTPWPDCVEVPHFKRY